ncbi:MAG: hypothetical protein O8C64_12365 [Candidatus Methanoperedens sp.]|nr:hypothetical protein [Candidatus Methanoperedens sp.]
MTLLVFEVLLFGLFSVLLGQFIGQSREAYAIWIREIVFSDGTKNSNDDKKRLCSNMESLSREICGLNDLISIVAGLIVLTFFVIFFTVIWNYNLMVLELERNITLTSTVLALMIVLALPYILSKLNINLIDPTKSSQIDDKIFEVWYENKCHWSKCGKYRFRLEPRPLYEILDEKINLKQITPTQEELELIKLLDKNNKSFKFLP